MRRHPTLVGAGVCLLLAVIFCGQGLLPDRTMSPSDYQWSMAPWLTVRPAGIPSLSANHENVDPATQFEPFMRYTRASLPDVPLWNPFIMGGRPFEANGQSAVFSPFSALTYVLPVDRSFVFANLLKLFLASFGTFLFATRALRMRFGGALVAGVTFAYANFMIAWLPWPLASVWVWIPWLLLAADRQIRAPSALRAAVLAAVVALACVGGHPESTFHVLALTTAWMAFRLIRRWRADRESRAAVRRAGAAAAAVFLGVALAAIALIPLAELLLHSADLHERASQGFVKMPSGFLLTILLNDYYGRPTQPTVAFGFLITRANYAGALPLLLAPLAVLLRPKAERIFFAVVGLLSMAVVVGLQPFTFAVRLIPGFGTTHNTRLVIIHMFALALLAGWGADELARRAPRFPRVWRGRAFAGLAVGLVAAPVVLLASRGLLRTGILGDALNVAWGFADMPSASLPGSADVVRLASLLEWLPFVLGGIAVIALRWRGRLGVPAFTALAVLLVVGDLFRAGMGENPAVPIRNVHVPTTPAIRYLQSRSPQRFTATSIFGAIPIWPNLGMRFGLYDARGYDYPVEDRYLALWKHNVVRTDVGFAPPALLSKIDTTSLRALDLLGVSSILTPPTDPPLRAPGVRLTYSGRDARIYTNTRALPRTFLVGGTQLVRGKDAALSAVTDPAFQARRVAVVEHPVPGLTADPPPFPPGRTQITHYGNESVRIRARTATPALVVLSDTWYPGWHATVDGHPAPIERVDFFMRGVAVGPGDHTVEMHFAPASWRIGWIVSLIALLAWLGLAGYGARPHIRTARARYSSRS